MKEEIIEPTLGVKVEDCKVFIEQIDDSVDTLDFHFLMSLKRHEQNGNESFSVNIQPLGEKGNIEFYGWKLKRLSFPGNWFGQIGVCMLEDKYGKKIRASVTNQFWVKEDYVKAIEKAIVGAVEFAKENPFASFYNFFEYGGSPFIEAREVWVYGLPGKSVSIPGGKDYPKNNEVSFNGFEMITKWVIKRTEEYKEVMDGLLEIQDDRFEAFKEKLNSRFSGEMSEYFTNKISF